MTRDTTFSSVIHCLCYSLPSYSLAETVHIIYEVIGLSPHSQHNHKYEYDLTSGA